MLDRFRPILQTPYHSSILPSVFVLGAPHAPSKLRLKATNHKGHEATLLKVMHGCLMSRYPREGRCLRLKTSAFKPCHILCQLGLGLDRADGVKAMSFEQTFKLSWSRVEKRTQLSYIGVYYNHIPTSRKCRQKHIRSNQHLIHYVGSILLHKRRIENIQSIHND